MLKKRRKSDAKFVLVPLACPSAQSISLPLHARGTQTSHHRRAWIAELTLDHPEFINHDHEASSRER